ncbi:hypothetical protein RYH80_18715 [Halobaculum sp. MBLA0147]|uniref:hypothetical protein n=1 Tax=Halobaculum sp. MBLA0147 TaxID=3079934 RepID=UPI003523BCF4
MVPRRLALCGVVIVVLLLTATTTATIAPADTPVDDQFQPPRADLTELPIDRTVYQLLWGLTAVADPQLLPYGPQLTTTGGNSQTLDFLPFFSPIGQGSAAYNSYTYANTENTSRSTSVRPLGAEYINGVYIKRQYAWIDGFDSGVLYHTESGVKRVVDVRKNPQVRVMADYRVEEPTTDTPENPTPGAERTIEDVTEVTARTEIRLNGNTIDTRVNPDPTFSVPVTAFGSDNTVRFIHNISATVTVTTQQYTCVQRADPEPDPQPGTPSNGTSENSSSTATPTPDSTASPAPTETVDEPSGPPRCIEYGWETTNSSKFSFTQDTSDTLTFRSYSPERPRAAIISYQNQPQAYLLVDPPDGATAIETADQRILDLPYGVVRTRDAINARTVLHTPSGEIRNPQEPPTPVDRHLYPKQDEAILTLKTGVSQSGVVSPQVIGTGDEETLSPARGYFPQWAPYSEPTTADSYVVRIPPGITEIILTQGLQYRTPFGLINTSVDRAGQVRDPVVSVNTTEQQNSDQVKFTVYPRTQGGDLITTYDRILEIEVRINGTTYTTGNTRGGEPFTFYVNQSRYGGEPMTVKLDGDGVPSPQALAAPSRFGHEGVRYTTTTKQVFVPATQTWGVFTARVLTLAELIWSGFGPAAATAGFMLVLIELMTPLNPFTTVVTAILDIVN